MINGSKTFTTNGHYADVCVAMAVTDKSKKSHGISAFIVEKGTKGFRPGKKENKLGMRASDTSEVIFSDCFVPGENLAGQRGRRIRQQLADSGWRTDFDCGAGAGDGAGRLRSGAEVLPSSASSSEKPSASFRRFNSSWPTWPRKSRRRDC